MTWIILKNIKDIWKMSIDGKVLLLWLIKLQKPMPLCIERKYKGSSWLNAISMDCLPDYVAFFIKELFNVLFIKYWLYVIGRIYLSKKVMSA